MHKEPLDRLVFLFNLFVQQQILNSFYLNNDNEEDAIGGEKNGDVAENGKQPTLHFAKTTGMLCGEIHFYIKVNQ